MKQLEMAEQNCWHALNAYLIRNMHLLGERRLEFWQFYKKNY